MTFTNPAEPPVYAIVSVLEQAALVAGVNPYNLRYLGSEREHGHIIPPEALGGTSVVSATRPPAGALVT